MDTEARCQIDADLSARVLLLVAASALDPLESGRVDVIAGVRDDGRIEVRIRPRLSVEEIKASCVIGATRSAVTSVPRLIWTPPRQANEPLSLNFSVPCNSFRAVCCNFKTQNGLSWSIFSPQRLEPVSATTPCFLCRLRCEFDRLRPSDRQG